MTSDDWQRLHQADAEILGKIGLGLMWIELPRVEIHLPAALARAALAAWERDDETVDLPVNESCEQKLVRGRAATLAMIGAAICERGRWVGEEVIFPLNPALIGPAIEASDDLPAFPAS